MVFIVKRKRRKGEGGHRPKLTPSAKICMAISWTTIEQNEAGGASEERRAARLAPPRECCGDPPSMADMLADKSPKINDYINETTK